MGGKEHKASWREREREMLMMLECGNLVRQGAQSELARESERERDEDDGVCVLGLEHMFFVALAHKALYRSLLRQTTTLDTVSYSLTCS